MPWVRIAEEFAEHPKLMKVGPLGMAMQVAALCYCNKNLTDGFIPWAAARSLLSWEFLGPQEEKGRKRYQISVTSGMSGQDVTSDFVIELLLEAGIWHEVDGGYVIHDYHDYQPSREQVLAEREKKREAGRKGGQASAQARAQAGAQAVAQATAQGPPQAKSKPVPDPVPVPKRDINPSPSETGTQSVAAAKGPSIEEVNGQKLIAELVAEYRTIEGVEPKNGDYPFLGALYNEYGYDRVLCALNRLRQAMAVQPLQKPLVYLKGILKREVEGGGTPGRHPPQAQPAKPGKYANIYVTHAGNGGRPDGGRSPPA